MPKPNFRKKPKQNVDWINCSDVENGDSLDECLRLREGKVRGGEGVNRFSLRRYLISVPMAMSGGRD
jgi:hypothetical protein